MLDNRSDPRPEPRSKRWFVALSVVAAILLALGVAVTLTVAGRRVPQASEPAGEPVATGISLDDIRAVKELADRIGADKLSDLAELFVR